MDCTEKLFLEELLGLVNDLEGTKSSIDIKDKLNRIRDKYVAVKDKQNLWTLLDQMCEDITQTYFSLLEYLYAATKEEEVLRKQLFVLTKGVKENSIDLFYALFYKWQLIHRNFMNFDSKLLFIERSKLHLEMLVRMREHLQFDLPPIPVNERNTNRIVVATTQLIGIKHGPTRNALDYCYTLQKKLNKEVFLFVAAEMPVNLKREYETYGLEYAYFTHCDENDGAFCIEYLGEKIRGFQCKINQRSREEIRDIIISIYQWKPYLIYNIGSENLIVDLIGSFTEEVSIPCGYVYPITEAKYHILPRSIEERDGEILDYLKERNHKVIESIFVYKLEESIKMYKKSDFGIDEDAYVISVVGGRLSNEIDTDFIQIIQAIIKMDRRIMFVFIGKFDDFEEKSIEIGSVNQLKYIGYQNDLRGIYHLVDLYLNPPRKGGGTSSVEALAEGVPVISLGNCDVAYSCGEEFLCSSLEEMPGLVHRYMTDEAFYQEQREKAILQAGRVVNTEEALRDILKKIE